MKTIIHIGSEKTGSTSIQAALGKHRAELLAAGILYPEWPDPSLKSHVIYPLFLGNDLVANPMSRILEKNLLAGQNQPVQTWERIEKAVADHDPAVLLLSSEVLFKKLPPEAEDIIKRISEMSTEVEVVAYLRNPRDFAISLTNQVFKQQVTCDRAMLESRLDYGAVLQSYADAFGQLPRVFKYGPDLMTDGSIVPHFFKEVLGVALPEEAKQIFWNLTPSPEALSILQSYFHALNGTDMWSFEDVDYRLMAKILKLDKALGKKPAELTPQAAHWLDGYLGNIQDLGKFGITFDDVRETETVPGSPSLGEEFGTSDFFVLDPDRVKALEARIKTDVPSFWAAYGKRPTARLRRANRRWRRR